MKTSIVCELTLEEIVTALTNLAKKTEGLSVGGSKVDFTYTPENPQVVTGAVVTFNGKSNPAI